MIRAHFGHAKPVTGLGYETFEELQSGIASDAVNHPSHYQRGGIETIDYIKGTLGSDGHASYCLGNVIKYVSRFRDKDGVQDLRKAQVYLGWAIAEMDASSNLFTGQSNTVSDESQLSESRERIIDAAIAGLPKTLFTARDHAEADRVTENMAEDMAVAQAHAYGTYAADRYADHFRRESDGSSV